MLKKEETASAASIAAAGAARELLAAAAAFIVGFAAGRALLFGTLAPFGVAACVAAHKRRGVCVALGAAAAALLPGGAALPVRYLAAMAAALLFRQLCAGLGLPERLCAPLCAGAATGATGLAVVLAQGGEMRDLQNCLIETALCACAAYFFTLAAPLLHRPARLRAADARARAGALFCLCVGLLALQPAAAGGVSLGRAAAVLCVLLAARAGGAASGCMAGAVLGLGLSMGGTDAMPMLAGYAAAGLVAGLFTPLGRFGSVFAFTLADLAAGCALAQRQSLLPALAEASAAGMVFLLLPQGFLCRVSALFAADTAQSPGMESARARLRQAGQAMRDAADTLLRVHTRLNAPARQATPEQTLEQAADGVCHRCGLKNYCWNSAYDDTTDAIRRLLPALQSGGEAARDQLPAHFITRCCRLEELLTHINRQFSAYAVHRAAQRQSGDLRGLLAEQWDIFASFLGNLDEQAQSAGRDLGAQPVRAALATCGLQAQSAACRVDARGRMTVEARLCAPPAVAINRALLAQELSAACGRRMEGPFVDETGGGTLLRFEQQAAFRLEHGQFSITKNGERLCGDAAAAFVENGRAVLLISDGMGAGSHAAVDANLTVELLTRFLRAGFDFASALRAANAALLLKSEEESFATVDAAVIDLYTGETQLYKAGAPASYLRRRGRAERTVQPSMPVGLLRQTDTAAQALRLTDGDVLVLVSDGVNATDDGWLLQTLRDFSAGPVDDFARRLAETAKRTRGDGHDDDITVLAARLCAARRL